MLIEFENMTEINNFDQVRRLKAQEKSNPVQWEANIGIIRNISKKGTADGGNLRSAGPHSAFISTSRPNKASSSISATINSSLLTEYQKWPSLTPVGAYHLH
jgi:hypothetical protein